MWKLIKFLKDTWKVLFAVFIVTATLLYSLIFDGSPLPFAATLAACIAIIFVKILKVLIDTVIFFYRKKSGSISDENKINFRRSELAFCIFMLFWTGWFLFELINLAFGTIINKF